MRSAARQDVVRPLLARARALEPEMRALLHRRFPDVAADRGLRLRPRRDAGSHEMLLVEAGDAPVRRLFLKGPRLGDGAGYSADEERYVLEELGSRIASQNPLTRTPALVAHLPELGALLLEMVDGVTLKSIVFGRGHPTRRDRVPELIRLCGRWLARFHGLTVRDRTATPSTGSGRNSPTPR